MTELSQRPQRHSPSLFGPIILIAIGAYLLLANLNLVSGLHWWSALQLWPLLLVFLGLNIIAQQMPRPFDALLSGGVGLLAVVVFGYVLLFGVDRLNLPTGAGNLRAEPIAFTADDVQSARIDLTIGPPGAELYALEDSGNLIQGTVRTRGEVLFDADVAGGEAEVSLDTRVEDVWFWNPLMWNAQVERNRWQIGLNPAIESDLSLRLNAGTSVLDLSELTLSGLELDANAGTAEVRLPDGNYDVTIDGNAAAVEVRLPARGRQQIDIQVNAGAITLVLPESMAARVEVQSEIGAFTVGDIGLHRVRQDGEREIWQTDGYEDATSRIDLEVHVNVGSVNIRGE